MSNLIELFPWKTEPDFRDWNVKGYHLIVVRHPSLGHLNGYVGVKITHPLYLKHYDHNQADDIMVHGGLTFSDTGWSMQHLSAKFKKSLWYFGFDTAHAGDFVPKLHELLSEVRKNNPGMPKPFFELNDYKNFSYVSAEVEYLCCQLQQIAKDGPKPAINHVKVYKKKRRIEEKKKRRNVV